MPPIKIVFIGPPAVGKTTIKKIFFDSEDPNNLLTNPLEPTYGIEISQYSIGSEIGVHDLAGQQLEEWLEHENSILLNTDLLILVLDGSVNWIDNEQIWLRLYRCIKKMHPLLKWVILFHKCDLLTNIQMNSLEIKIKQYPFAQLKVESYLTSILEVFFNNTFKIMINLIKMALNPTTDQDYLDYMKLQLIGLFFQEKVIPFSHFIDKKLQSEQKLYGFLESLQNQNIISVDFLNKIVTLNPYGINLIEKYKKRNNHQFIFNENQKGQLLKGFFLSDLSGQLFFEYMENKLPFDIIFNKMGDDIDFSMISSFLINTKTFGDLLDCDGIKTIKFKGQNLQMIILIESEIIGGFFIEKNSLPDNKVFPILRNYLSGFSNEYTNEISLFIQTGDFSFFINNLKLFQNRIDQVKIELTQILEDFETTQHLYFQIEHNSQFTSQEKKSIRDDIFHFLITNKPKSEDGYYSKLNQKGNHK